jgi:hypothetical protein
MTRLGCLLLFAATTLHAGTTLQPTPFETHSPGYVVTSPAGTVVEEEGASLTLSAQEKPKQFGTATAHADATPAILQRVTLSGELRTTAVAGGASLWLRVDGGKRMFVLDNGVQNALRGDADWTKRSITLPVPPNATQVVFGVLLQAGGGAVDVRHLRLTTSPLPTTLPSPAAAKLLDEAIGIVRANALHTKDVDWSAREPEIRALAAGAEQTSDVYGAIKYLLLILDDGHSFFMPPAQTTANAKGGADNPMPEVASKNDVVSIAMPGYSGTDPTAARLYALRMFKALEQSAPAARCGWIVDLRNDGGGNMYPMLNGLKPFLGDDRLGFFVTSSQKVPWVTRGLVPPPLPLMKLRTASVAVITGPHTASSGEIVAIAFRGRPHVRSFGHPTAGLTTANRAFPLSDGSSLALAVSIDADRTGHVYGGKLDPDEVVDDATVLDVASKWLHESSGCDAH